MYYFQYPYVWKHQTDFRRDVQIYGLVKDVVYILCLVFIFGPAEEKQSLWQTFYKLYLWPFSHQFC